MRLPVVHPGDSGRRWTATPWGGAVRRKVGGTRLLAVVAFAVIVLLVRRYDALPVLGATVLIAAAVPVLLWPEIATVLAVFLLYTNIPVLASKNHGVPEPIAASFILLLGIPLLHQLIVRRERLRTDGIIPLLLLFLSILLVASLGARSTQVALEYVARYIVEGFLLYFLVINTVRTMPAMRRVIWTVLAAGALLGGLSLYQEVTGSFGQQFGGLSQRNFEYLEMRRQLALNPDDPVLREQVLTHGTGERSSRAEGPMDEPNRYAQIMIVLLPLAVFSYRSADSRRVRLLAAAAGGLIAGGLIVTQSRGAFVSLALLLVIGLFLRWVRPVHLLLGTFALAAVVPIMMPDLLKRIESITTAVDLVQDDPSVQADGAIRGRATAMMAAFQAFTDHPFLGVGPGQYTPFYSADYHQKNPRLRFRDLRQPRRAHSLYFEMAAELGIIGLGVFLSIVLRLMLDLWRARRKWIQTRPEATDLVTAFCLSLLAYMCTALFLHLSFARYFWLLVALSGAALLVVRSLEPQPEARPADSR